MSRRTSVRRFIPVFKATALQAVVVYWGVPTSDGQARGFPTPVRLAAASVAELRSLARVGYRADFIHALADRVARGSIDLVEIESFEGPSEARQRLLKQLPGVGDYSAAHLCMLLGDYSRLAIDTEMIRFFRGRHPRRRPTPVVIRAAYRRWHPYEYLAYWHEIWSDYTRRHGPSALWAAADMGRRITDHQKANQAGGPA
ncbi:MAG TPA: endonuclease III domain-containing protein [Phycisphaerae bacterium]|nr:endonuclease III domain-containing protein [Phycisphaerae bacterium]